MALTKEEKETLDDIKEAVIILKTVLLGADSDEGLVGVVKRVAAGHSKLNRYFWTLVALLVGSGVLAVDKLGLLGG